MESLELLVLASGSKGNAAVVRNAATGESVLVDCGICKRDFLARCAQFGLDPAGIRAVFVSHEHTDHTKGLGVVMRGLAKMGVHPVLYASNKVRNASAPIEEVCAGSARAGGARAGGANAAGGLVAHRALRAGEVVEVAGMRVRAFPTSHDCAESFGFRIEADGDALGWMTDTGVVTSEAHEALCGVRILGIESNHDVDMLRTGPYPWPLKQRVGGEFGHLSNDQCRDEVARLLHGGLQRIACLHISENNNTYGLPRRVIEDLLRQEGHPATVASALQHSATAFA